MSYWPLIACTVVGMGITVLLIPLVLKAARARKLGQRGNDLHHAHMVPVPRLGGLALAVAFIGLEVFASLVFPELRSQIPHRPVVILSSLAMFALGFWDDLKPLGAKRKLAGQILIAIAVSFSGIGIERLTIPFTATPLELGGWGVCLTILWLVGMTNLINLIDGVDGLAGGISLMLMVLLAIVAHQAGTYALLISGMAGALLGFLCFNFPPARIYLGDGGAYFLGFQIGLYSIVSSHKGTVFAALVAPHRLLQIGFSRRKVVLTFYAVTLIFLALAFAAYWSRGNFIPLLLGIGVLILLFCASMFRFSQNWFAVGRVLGNSLQMRQEVHYALALMRWVELEGSRCHSVEEIWKDFLFAAQRLGFNSVKVSLADGVRVWEPANSCLPMQSVVRVLQNGGLGTLELKAYTCTPSARLGQPGDPCGKSLCPCVANEQVFEIVSELLAEGWVNAVRALKNGDGVPHDTPLSFDTRRHGSQNPSPRWFPGCLTPAFDRRQAESSPTLLGQTVREAKPRP
ncbi:MAG: MraY family glycosyltransferase [Verrucomicrobia bacterium]|nr:MraY family glycosyltransferase [Verrucomicrobiota bacterium]